MSQKPIREFDGKRLLAQHLNRVAPADLKGRFEMPDKVLRLGGAIDMSSAAGANPWVHSEKLVVKPDQLIKRRGKANLLGLKMDWEQVCAWVSERNNKHVTVEHVTGRLTNFIVEPFVPHTAEEELYLCIQSVRAGDEVLFYHQGGVDVGDVDAKAVRLLVPIGSNLSREQAQQLTAAVANEATRALVADFLVVLFLFYKDLHFAYFEVNPLVVTGGRVYPLDIAAKVDQTADFLCDRKWGDLEFPPPFGRDPYPEEAYIADLDSKTGSSLKLTVLNPNGRVWMMVAGGGASVVYADAVADMGYGTEMANYGEYSGDPTDTLTYEYAKTIIQLMTKGEPAKEGKVLIVGGGIANFTNVAATFKGIVNAIRDNCEAMQRHNVRIFVRRGGPNYQEGLISIKNAVSGFGIPIQVYGPDTHITSIVSLALGKRPAEECWEYGAGPDHAASGDTLRTSMQRVKSSQSLQGGEGLAGSLSSTALTALESSAAPGPSVSPSVDAAAAGGIAPLFARSSKCIIYGLQTQAVQRMLDFDFISGRKASVAAVVYPFAGDHYQKFHWGADEMLMPIYEKMTDALVKCPEVDILVNFASFRQVYASTMEAIASRRFRVIAIIAEGVPEHLTRLLIKEAEAAGAMLIGPATVGGIMAGVFRIGNTGGAIDNIIASRLYRPGSVGYVSKSGGMSNELNNIIARHTDGVCEGVAIGGDRYPGSTFIDHLLRYQANPAVKLLVLLGEVGGTEEYRVCEAIKDGRITKPLVAWCVGTCAKLFPYEVQFGHAGALAGAASETADAKNVALRAAGGHVPESFEEFGRLLGEVYRGLLKSGVIVQRAEPAVPSLPMDYDWAAKLGLIRKPASFISTISDDRGEELLYAGMPITRVFSEDLGIGGVVSLLWFKRRLPPYACKFIEMAMMVTADHGPAVSGAHNTIVTARAGKDLISSLCSGLLTIGPRFGGAIDTAAEQFSYGLDSGLSAHEFVSDLNRRGVLISGIGHRVKSIQNPDMRVELIKNFARQNFPNNACLDFALEVEKVTTKKRNNLILNVDGTLGVCFVDLLRSTGAFTRQEADEYVKIGTLNGIFVLGRSIGFIGHFLDQKRLKQSLYRHATDDISYFVGQDM